jgi:hypothetical protein
VLVERRGAVEAALTAVPDGDLAPVVEAVGAMLVALTDDLRTSEHMCRLCDERACPDDRCPVEHAEPAPPHRRGQGYGVTRSAGTRG